MGDGEALGHSGRDSKAQRSVSSLVDSLIEDGKLEDRVTYLISKLGDSFDRKDSLAVVRTQTLILPRVLRPRSDHHQNPLDRHRFST